MFARYATIALCCSILFACGAEPQQSSTSPAETSLTKEVATPEESAPATEPAPVEEEPAAVVPDLKKPEMFDATAPAEFKVKFETTKGNFTIVAHREWSPLGVDRLYNMVQAGYFVDTCFFRAVQGFIVQFGLHADPNITYPWQSATLKDEPVVKGNLRGYVTYAKGGPDTRSVQFFVNTANNSRLDAMGFAAIAEVSEGMDVVDALYTGYGERVDQGRVIYEGNAYLKQAFPKLDYINKATIVE